MWMPNEVLAWRKPLRCSSGGCVEVALGAAAVYLRDAKDPEGLVLAVSHATWAGFVIGLKDGMFDIGR